LRIAEGFGWPLRQNAQEGVYLVEDVPLAPAPLRAARPKAPATKMRW
jgi:hypothetical protein